MAVRIMADSLAMTARSSAAVLQARTCRMRSRSLSDIIILDGCSSLALYACSLWDTMEKRLPRVSATVVAVFVSLLPLSLSVAGCCYSQLSTLASPHEDDE
jgi:hypothetical protein